jgi:hypothetical protein
MTEFIWCREYISREEAEQRLPDKMDQSDFFPKTLIVSRGKYGRSDRYYPSCSLSELLCSLMRRGGSRGEVQCLMGWQLDKLREFGFTVEIEEE